MSIGRNDAEMSSTSHAATPHYFVPAPSRHPALAAIGLLFVIFGATQWINGVDWGKWSLALGLVWFLVVLFQWFSEAVGESEGGQYGHKIDLSFRWSMSWFIFSEVMFFGAFFTALWWSGAIRYRLWATWKIPCCGLISKLSGPAWRPAPPDRRPASWSLSRP